MSENNEQDEKIRQRLKSGFLGQLLVGAQISSMDVQSDFVEQVNGVSKLINRLVRDNIGISKIDIAAKEFWEKERGSP